MASRGGGGVDGGLDELLRVLQRATDTPVAGGSNACRGVREGIEITQGMPCVLRGMTQVSDGRERRGPWSDDARDQAPSAYLRPSYPLAGCSPAEPTSVSPGEKSIPQACRRCKINQELPVRKPGKSVAKEWPFFVQRMGSTSPSAGQIPLTDRSLNTTRLVATPPLPQASKCRSRASSCVVKGSWGRESLFLRDVLAFDG